jgi:serine protease
MGEQLTVSDGIVWPASEVPGAGHYCFVGIIGTAGDPAPAPADFLDFDNFRTFIRNNNNVTWRNFNIEDNEPAPATGFVVMPFLAPGWPDQRIRMRLEFEAPLPAGAKLFLEAPLLFLELAQAFSPYVKIDRKAKLGRLPLPIAGRFTFADMIFPAKARFEMGLRAQIPKKHRENTYRVVVRQLHGKDELGRATWLLAPKRKRA